jgi:hypothetical protein
MCGPHEAREDTVLFPALRAIVSKQELSALGYGAGWLAGSTTTGLLYEHSVPAVIGFSIVVQLTSLPLFIAAERLHRRERKSD